MSTRNSVLLTSFLLLISLFFLGTHVRALETFNRDLRLGDIGDDVMRLQATLNANSATRVASSGPGSPGNETTTFGALTADAVRRYQELHASEILAPLGLSGGTGFFGLATRRLMNGESVVVNKTGLKTTPTTYPVDFSGTTPEEDPDKEEKDFITQTVERANMKVISEEKMKKASQDTNIVPETAATPPTPRAVMELAQGQNEENVEGFIRFLEEGGYLDDMDEETKNLVKARIREDAKKDPDTLVEEYEREKESEGVSWRIPQVQKQEKEPFPDLANSIIQFFKPKKANAQFLPLFGGPIYYRFYCWQSGTWAVLIGYPMPAWIGYTYVQAYAYWQFPFSIWAKGWYVPGVQTCWIYVNVPILIPTMGAASFMMGTSMP